MEILLKKTIPLTKLAQLIKVPTVLIQEANKNNIINDHIIKDTVILVPYHKFYEDNDIYEILPSGSTFKNKLKSYYDSKILNHNINYLLQQYPFIKSKIIGHSVLNKKINELTIGTGKVKTHFNAAFHGNEWITSIALMYCIENYARLLVKGNKTLLNRFKTMSLSIVPMVNPDGVDLSIHGKRAALQYEHSVLKFNQQNEDFSRWKANINGVDLNKQFPARWEETRENAPQQPHYRDFPGYKPFSEPETKAIKQLVEENNFKRIYAFHTQGEEIYWGFDSFEPPISHNISQRLQQLTEYKAIQYINNYAGFKDWFIKAYQKPGFTIEFGHGENPLSLNQLQKINQIAWIIFKENLLLNNSY